MTKCIGCGVTLQYDNPNGLGFTVNKESKLCKRCFDLKNYNKDTILDNDIDNIELINNINSKKIFTLFLCDVLSFNDNVVKLYQKITNDKIFILTKVDIFPKNILLDKVLNNIKNNYNINCMLYSSLKNDFNDQMRNFINSKEKVIICGITSSGKSTMINKLFNKDITVSSYKNTTQDFIEVKDNDILLYDTPGFDNISNTVNIKKPLKVKTIKLKKDYALYIDDNIICVDRDLNITVFYQNNANIITKKSYLEILNSVNINAKSDLLFSNSFIYFKNECKVNIKGKYELRKSIVGSYE